MRKGRIERETAETRITLQLTLDGGETSVDTGCGFLDHMLTLFSRHSGFGLTVHCDGDTQVDYHHTVEDVGICLGQAFAQALGDKRGIRRYGDMLLPMDEALVAVAADISGRGYLAYHMPMPTEKVGDFDTELGKEFFAAFARCAGVTLHIRLIAGENSHHILEAAFKGCARVLGCAVSMDAAHRDEIPSTKGILD